MNRTAIVTGAAGGLGREIALALAETGHHVISADLHAQPGVTVRADPPDVPGVTVRAAPHDVPGVTVRAEPHDRAGVTVGVRADVRDPADLDRIVAAARAHGGPHVLVNNAGGWSPNAQYPEAPAAEWTATMTLNLLAPMLLSQLVLDPMRRAGGGAIVNIASSAALGFEAYGSPEYAAAKAGLIRFTTSLTALADTHDIRMMCVTPGWIGLDRARDQVSPAEFATLIPLSEVVTAVLDLIAHGTAGTVVTL